MANIDLSRDGDLVSLNISTSDSVAVKLLMTLQAAQALANGLMQLQQPDLDLSTRIGVQEASRSGIVQPGTATPS